MSDTQQIELPALSDERIAVMERRILDDIGPARPATPVRRRRRGWLTALGVAAAFATGIVAAPGLVSALNPDWGGSGGSAVTEAGSPVDEAPAESAGGSSSADGGKAADTSAGGGETAVAPTAGREIITTAQVELRVADVSDAADSLSLLAAEHGGYVESADLGASSGSDAPVASDASMPSPREPGTGWVSIRIDAEDLDEVLRAIGEDGQVLRSAISRQDVTSTAVDLRARVDAARASVKRLTELMAKSGSVADLIAAESALSERQAQLESYEQELKRLDEQVALSTVTVQLTERTTATEADPAGFADGLLAGWNGLVAALNALVVAFGFLLPWLVIAGIVVLVMWLIRRRRAAALARLPLRD